MRFLPFYLYRVRFKAQDNLFALNGSGFAGGEGTFYRKKAVLPLEL